MNDQRPAWQSAAGESLTLLIAVFLGTVLVSATLAILYGGLAVARRIVQWIGGCA